MRKQEVRVGEVYLVRVGGKPCPVRIDAEVPLGGLRLRRTGWRGVNLATGRNVLIRSAQRLRGRMSPEDVRRVLGVYHGTIVD